MKAKGTLHYDSIIIVRFEPISLVVDRFHSGFTKDDEAATLPELPHHNPIEDLQIREEGVRKLLENIVLGSVHSKAPGPDPVPNRILKESAAELAPGLTAICQQSVNRGTLPVHWTGTNISPVFKKGNKHLAENYR